MVQNNQTKPNQTKPIPEWAKVDRKIVFDGRLRKYRARYLDGYFDWSGNELGDSIIIQPLETRWIKQSRYGKPENYFDIAFIDSDNVASCLSLQRDSATNVAGWLAKVQGRDEPIDPKALKLNLTLIEEKTMGKDGGASYYAAKIVGFDFVEEAQFKAAAAFLRSEKYQNNRWQGVTW
jgi:hypothetical protein